MMLNLLKNLSILQKILNGYKEVATNAGVKDVETRLEFGSPNLIIPKKLAHEINAESIMSGTSGLNAVERFIVGSVLILSFVMRHVTFSR